MYIVGTPTYHLEDRFLHEKAQEVDVTLRCQLRRLIFVAPEDLGNMVRYSASFAKGWEPATYTNVNDLHDRDRRVSNPREESKV